MKNNVFILILLISLSCQTTKIKSTEYEITQTNTELGSIGESVVLLNTQKKFKTRTFPKLENEIRLAIEIIPFNEKLAKMYESKAKYNQSQLPIIYTDSLAVKPELATVEILDVTGVVQELNATYNKEVYELLSSSDELEIVTAVAIALPAADLAKIREADAYYLNNGQEKKYTISLMKQGKKIGILDLGAGTIIANKLSKFCWSENQKGKWYIADISENGCSGTMKARPKKRDTSKNLYKL